MTKAQNHIRLIDLGKTDWWNTQAVYHALAEAACVDKADVIILCQPATPYFCLGYHQDFDSVFDRRACENLQLPVIRRRLGGGATYLDENQLFYQFIFHESRVPVFPKQMYAKFLALPVAALQALGVDARLERMNEIEIEQKRIAGIGGGQIGEARVVVGNILLDFDYTMLPKVWQKPSEDFGRMAAAGLRKRLTTLRELVGEIPVDEVNDALKQALKEALGAKLHPDELTQNEEAAAVRMYKKLVSPSFLNLHSENGKSTPMPALKISAREHIHFSEIRFFGHLIRGNFRVCEGVIEECRLHSATAPALREAEISLTGQPFGKWRRHLGQVVQHSE